MKSRQNGPLSRALVLDDAQQLVEAYHRHGRFNARVTPKIIDAKAGRVTLVFEIEEGERTGVGEIRFTGNAAFPDRKLKDVVATGETNFLSSLLGNDLYAPDKTEQDQDRLRRYYRSRGFADFAVASPTAVYDPQEHGLVLTYAVDEGVQYRLETVKLESRIDGIDAAGLDHLAALRTGDVYDGDAADRAARAIATELMKRAHPFVRVRVAIARHPERRTLDLSYVVEEAPPAYVDRIEIIGNTKTADDVIRREIQFAEGDACNDALVARSEARLKRLGYFKSVRITQQRQSVADRVIVKVTVEEQNTGLFSVSGGYSDAQGWLGEVSVGDTNIGGRGETAKVTATLGQYSKGFDAAFTKPYIFGEHVSATADLFARETSASAYQSYNSTIYGASLTIGTPITDTLTTSWRYAIKNQSLSLAPSAVPISLPVQQAAAAGPQWVSTVGSGMTFDTLNNPKDPTSGLHFTINNDVAGAGGDVRFFQNTENVRYYQQLADNVVGVAHLQAGYITPWGGQALPLLDGFFGGPQLVRGFAPNGFGPRDLTPSSTMDNVGGNAYWATSYELQTPVPWVPSSMNLKAAIFADAGSLWTTSAAKSSVALSGSLIGNSSTVRSSVGAGLVWNSVLGPLRVDYAYPLSQASYDVTQRLHFGYGY
ncbi:MAG: outer membrane protein assembly factor BamA [Xanthobacteraceae bacterium]